jgi:hypothetical protein
LRWIGRWIPEIAPAGTVARGKVQAPIQSTET